MCTRLLRRAVNNYQQSNCLLGVTQGERLSPPFVTTWAARWERFENENDRVIVRGAALVLLARRGAGNSVGGESAARRRGRATAITIAKMIRTNWQQSVRE